MNQTPNRECGNCKECCFHLPVEPLDKPAGVACVHLIESPCGSCDIYAQRPNACKLYTCSWLDGLLDFDLRPDRCGMLFETARIEWPRPLQLIMGFEHVEGAAAKWEDRLSGSARPGMIIGVVPFDGEGAPLYIGLKEDLETFAQFMQQAEREGGVKHQFVDGDVEVKF